TPTRPATSSMGCSRTTTAPLAARPRSTSWSKSWGTDMRSLRTIIAACLLPLAAGPAFAQEGDVTPPSVEKDSAGEEPSAPTTDAGWTSGWKIRPYAALVGGIEYETLQTKEDNPA